MDDQIFAQKFGIPIYPAIDHFPFVEGRVVRIPYLLARQKKALPIDETESEVIVAVADLKDLDTLTELRIFLKKEVFPVFCEKSVLESAIEKCYHQKEEDTKRFFSTLDKESSKTNTEQEYDLLEQSEENPVIRMVNTLLLEAIQQGASDIHFEPTQDGLSVRYRLDGILQHKHTPSSEYRLQILTRLKVMAKMDIAEHRLPQDGRIKLHHGGREIDFRVSSLPTIYGERIVIRILDKGNVVLGIDHLGMEKEVLEQFRRLIYMPEGIVLVTGPTGSGKTTTLYSALSEINSQETNIITVEDPVEYKMEGIAQMHVNSRIDLTFAKGLRHILRQDPDVIMIGEIRDKETAEIAIQASLTGHLVFSTLHTNDAPSALTRLADMGIAPYLLASSILGVLAQRLVRKICPDCKISYAPSKEEIEELHFLETNLVLRKGKGCAFCMGTGYRGRLALYELMYLSPEIKEQVLLSQDAQELKEKAILDGMRPLFEHGKMLVMQGLTTTSELLRVTRIQ